MKLPILVTCCLSLLSLNACINQGITGSGVIRPELRDLPAFTEVSIQGGFQFTFQENPLRSRHEVRLNLDDNLSQLVSTEVINGRLEVRFTQPVSGGNREIQIEGPSLRGITLNTRTIGTINKLSGIRQAALSVIGDSELNIQSLESDSCNFTISGLSRLNIGGGACSRVVANVNGKSDLGALNLQTIQTEINLSQESFAKVKVRSLLTVSLSDKSTLEYDGSPQIQQRLLSRDSKLAPVKITSPRS